MTNNPIYKIQGKERKKLRSECSKLASVIKNFWYYHNIEPAIQSDEDNAYAELRYNELIDEHKKLKSELDELYK